MSKYEAIGAQQERQDTAVDKIKRFAWVDNCWVPDPDGGWVLFNEVKTRFNDEVRKIAHRSAVMPDAIANARNEGVAYATQKFEEERAAVKAERTRTNALLNELYHDRARLEKIVSNAADLAKDVTLELEDLRVKLPAQDLGSDLMVSQVALAAFADANGT